MRLGGIGNLDEKMIAASIIQLIHTMYVKKWSYDQDFRPYVCCQSEVIHSAHAYVRRTFGSYDDRIGGKFIVTAGKIVGIWGTLL